MTAFSTIHSGQTFGHTTTGLGTAGTDGDMLAGGLGALAGMTRGIMARHGHGDTGGDGITARRGADGIHHTTIIPVGIWRETCVVDRREGTWHTQEEEMGKTQVILPDTGWEAGIHRVEMH